MELFQLNPTVIVVPIITTLINKTKVITNSSNMAVVAVS